VQRYRDPDGLKGLHSGSMERRLFHAQGYFLGYREEDSRAERSAVTALPQVHPLESHTLQVALGTMVWHRRRH
jgi:hypothetical protein